MLNLDDDGDAGVVVDVRAKPHRHDTVTASMRESGLHEALITRGLVESLAYALRSKRRRNRVYTESGARMDM